MSIITRSCRTIRKLYQKLCLAALLLFVSYLFLESVQLPAQDTPLPEGVYSVRRAVDGDTLLLENGLRIRLLGVDTPETVKPEHEIEPFGPEASEYTKNALKQVNYQIYIRLDRERVDKYGRYLAYVYLGKSPDESSRLLNEELIQQGLGRALLTFNYNAPMKRRFAKAQQYAKENRLGIWSLNQPISPYSSH